MKSFGIALAVASLVGFAATDASAAVVYQDSFDRVGALNGSMPDVVSGGQVWTSNANIATDGALATVADGNEGFGSGGRTARLPLTPAAGWTYVLSADVTNLGGDGIPDDLTGWATIAFVTADFPTTGNHNNVNSIAWTLLGFDGAAQGFKQGAGGGDDAGAGPILGTTQTLAMELVVALDGTGVVNYFANGNPYGAQVVLSAANVSSIGAVGLGNWSTGAAFDNFTLTAVPEPSALCIGGLATLATVVVRRGRRRRK